MKLLELNNVIKSFSGRLALNNVSMTVDDGEVLAIMGPSGSGKTTLLRLIDLLIYPTSGCVIFEGVDTDGDGRHQRTLRRRIGAVFQHPALFDTTVFNNVALGLRIRGHPGGEVKEKVHKALETVGLLELEKRRANTLSGGEAQRVALARALVIDPKLLLLDEPTVNLDPGNAAIIERTVSAINRESKVTAIIATHNMFQARRLARRVGFLLAGELVVTDEVEGFFNHPKDRRVEAFIKGDMVY